MKQHLCISLFAGALFGLAACSQDTLGPADNSDTEGNVPAVDGYFAFRLEDPEMRSRDTHKEYDDDYERYEWFNRGTADERAIIPNSECNRVLFFNSDYSFAGSGKLGKPTEIKVASNVYLAEKPEDVTELPAYAMVVINSDPERLDQLEDDLTAAGTNAVNTLLFHIYQVNTDDPESLAMCKDDNGKKYFTMTSTVYRGGEDDNENKIVVLKTFDSEDPVFYETEEEALLSENLTTFNVERLLSKHTLIIKGIKNADKDGHKTFDTDETIIINAPNKLKVRKYYTYLESKEEQEGEMQPENPDAGDDTPQAAAEESEEDLNKDVMSSWRIHLINWGLNGLEKNNYLMKTLSANPTAAYPWDLPNNYYIGWNSPQLHRSYWGLDENYSTGVYPYQYRQALDVAGVEAATTNNIYSAGYDPEAGLTKGDYTLVYKPFNAFTDRTANKYTVENTFDVSVMNGQDISSSPWLRCGTHVLITAQMIIDEIDTNIDINDRDEKGLIKGVSDKYFSNGLYWAPEALLQQAVSTLISNIYYNKDTNPIPNVLGDGNVEFINTDKNPLDDLKPVIINGKAYSRKELVAVADQFFEFAPAFIKGGDGWVSIKLIDGVSIKANLGADKEPKDISQAQLVSYIYKFTNLAKHYTEGRMYYALPLRHNLDSENFLQNPVTEVSTGDYGVVRNTWYRLTVNSIEIPGTPVDDPEQPIIPNPQPDDKSLGVEVEIIPWRTVEINVDQLH